MDNFPPKENWKLENYSWDEQYNYNSGTEFSSILKTTQVFPSRHIFWSIPNTSEESQNKGKNSHLVKHLHLTYVVLSFVGWRPS